MTDYKSFGEAANAIEKKRIRLKKTMDRDALHAVGVYLRRKIRAMHGVRQPGWKVSILNPGSPLLKTGGLRNAVSFRTGRSSVSLFSRMDWLARIHEYGATWKMTDKQRKFLMMMLKEKGALNRRGRPRKTWGQGLITIPARPLWRRVYRVEKKNVRNIIFDIVRKAF